MKKLTGHERALLAVDIGATKIDAHMVLLNGALISCTPLILTPLSDLLGEDLSFSDYLDRYVRLALNGSIKLEDFKAVMVCAAGLVEGGLVRHEPYPRGRFEVRSGCDAHGLEKVVLCNDGVAQASALYRPEVWDAGHIIHEGDETNLSERDASNIGFLGLGTGLAYTHNVRGEVIGAEGGNTRLPWIPSLDKWCPPCAGLYEYLSSKYRYDEDRLRWETIVSIAGIGELARFITGKELETTQEVDEAVEENPAIAQAFAFWVGLRAASMVIDAGSLSGVALRGARRMEILKGHEDWFINGILAAGVRGRTMAFKKGYFWYQLPNDTIFGLLAQTQRGFPELFAA